MTKFKNKFNLKILSIDMPGPETKPQQKRKKKLINKTNQTKQALQYITLKTETNLS
jgi:hypothetical protein